MNPQPILSANDFGPRHRELHRIAAAGFVLVLVIQESELLRTPAPTHVTALGMTHRTHDMGFRWATGARWLECAARLAASKAFCMASASSDLI
jgi:hypothetical protein